MKKARVQEFMRRVERLFAGLFGDQETREIKEVDSWDGSASNYADTEAYCNACLINVNAESDPANWTQDHCMLPVRGPDDGASTYVKQALHAAAGGHGLTQVKKPDDVAQEAWDAAVKSAANTLIGAYEDMDEMAPDAIYEAAGKTPPENRAVSLDDVYYKVWDAAEAHDPWCWVNNLYYEDDGQPFAILTSAGKLYRADVMVANGEVTLGEWVEVKIDFPPVTQARTVIRRQADGHVRWFSVAGSNALNRSGEIDAAELFRSFEEHIAETGEYPIRQFYHAGGVFRTGQHDFVATYEEDGVSLLITSGLYDDTELAKREIEAREKEPTYWGNSIGFLPTQTPEMLTVADGVEIPVYTRGILMEESTLPETQAAAWMTAVPTLTEVTRMLQTNQMDAFIKLFDGDETAANAWLEANAAERAKKIREAGMITRDSHNSDAHQETEETPAPSNFVLDEAAVEAIARAIVEGEGFTALVNPLMARMTALESQLSEIANRQDAQTEARGQLDERVRALEATDAEKQATWLADLPASKRNGVNVTYRPRTTPETPASVPTDADLAAETLKRAPVSY